VTQDQLNRWQSEQAMNPLTQIVASLQQKPQNGAVPVGVPAG
jgi:hypothetical protein